MWSLRFDQTIGAGAFGTVYLAELKNEGGLRRPVAVKMIVQGHADSEMFLTRMRDEARLLGMLKDRNVLQVLDLITLEGRDAIVMEYVNGADLEVVLDARGPLPPKAVCEIGTVIGGALDRAHRAVHPQDGTPLGVVHRDVKPANIMLTPSGDLRLLDFGVAREEVPTQKVAPTPPKNQTPDAFVPATSKFDEEPTVKAVRRAKILTRHLEGSNSVTIKATAPSPVPSPPPRSSRKAVLGGAVIGGLVGLLAVAGLAILLFG